MCALRSSALAFAAIASLTQSQDPQPSPYIARQLSGQNVMSWDEGRSLCFDKSDSDVDGMATLDTSTLATSVYSLDEQFDLLRESCAELTNADGRKANCWVAGRLNPERDGYIFASKDTLRLDYSPLQGDFSRWGCVRNSDGVTCEKDIEGTQLDNGEDYVCLFQNRNYFFADWPQNGGSFEDFLVTAVICNNAQFSYDPDNKKTTTTTTSTTTTTPAPTEKVDPDALCDVAQCDAECACTLQKNKQCDRDLAECLGFGATSLDCLEWLENDAAARSEFLRVNRPDCLELVEEFCCAEEDLGCACDAAPAESPSDAPTARPIESPTGKPTSPTRAPTPPTGKPTAKPTGKPTQPTRAPTQPTKTPTQKPTGKPTGKPTKEKTQKPTKKPIDNGSESESQSESDESESESEEASKESKESKEADSATVICRGDCECPNAVSECTLSATGEDSAKDSKVSCASSSVCTILCVGKSSCGDAEIDGGDVKKEMSVLCEGEDACKGNTVIDCGSVKRCSLHCEDATSCEDATVNAQSAGSFECSGYCDAIGQVSTSDSDDDESGSGSGDYYIYFDRKTKEESKWNSNN